MDQELKAYLDGRFSEVHSEFGKVHGELEKVQSQFQEVHRQLQEVRGEIESVETRLLTEFWKWGRVSESTHSAR